MRPLERPLICCEAHDCSKQEALLKLPKIPLISGLAKIPMSQAGHQLTGNEQQILGEAQLPSQEYIAKHRMDAVARYHGQ